MTVAIPELAPGWQDVTVTLPGGATYTAASVLRVAGSAPTPVITGFSPAGVGLQAECTIGFTATQSVTVVGSGFANYDTVEIDGKNVSSAFIDSGDIQATVPAGLTCAYGSLPVTVDSPYTGASNTASLPIVNPVPVLSTSYLTSYTPGSNLSLMVVGSNFVSSSMVQWNGQNVSAALLPGEANGFEELQVTIPSTLTQQGGMPSSRSTIRLQVAAYPTPFSPILRRRLFICL